LCSLQFNYGEDGLDVCQTPYLHQFEFICENYEGFLDKYQTGNSANAVDFKAVADYKRQVRKKKIKDPDPVLSVLNPSLCLGSVSDRYVVPLAVIRILLLALLCSSRNHSLCHCAIVSLNP
jgi:hypothetical protein